MKKCKEAVVISQVSPEKKNQWKFTSRNWLIQLWRLASLKSIGQAAGWKLAQELMAQYGSRISSLGNITSPLKAFELLG
jgi:hypothetical protein